MIGKILGGRYEIIEEIGKGGMAYVYKAKCVLLNRIVAVKILRDDLDGGDEFLERFNTEAQAAASLSHSNIVSIFDVGIDQGKHYIVMEYVGGITLKEYIVEKGIIPYKEALDISYQICDAMQAAHEKNIVHRDIKPHNILVTDDRNVKVTDFGIARSGTTNTISGGNDILGSVHYISPEQAKGETVDTRSDLYSLGIVLYEMLTGKVPFDSDTPVAVAMMQIEQEAPAIYDSDIPRGILQIMYKAMCKDKNKRYQNAEEIKNDILSIIENEDFLIPDGDNYYNDYDYSSSEEKYVKLGLPMKTAMVFLAIITSFILVASAVGIYNWVSDMSGSPTKISASDKVPDVLGLTLEEAQKKAADNGFKIIVSDEVNDEKVKPGTIISQTPSSGSVSGKDATIKVVINKSEEAELKDYEDKSYKSAESELKDLGCEVNLIFEESKKEEDIVIRQSPEAGTKITKDMTVTLYVSSGISEESEYKTVPTLTGKTYKKCLELLGKADLVVGSISGVDSPSNDDVVVSQAIPAGSMVKPGSAVAITLKGKKSDNANENSGDDNQPDQSANNTGDSDTTTPPENNHNENQPENVTESANGESSNDASSTENLDNESSEQTNNEN